MTDPDEVLEQLQSLNPEERRRAVSLVSGEGLPKSNSWIVKTMGDSDWRVRKEATGVALRRAPDPELLDELLQALLPGDNVGMRNAAVEALGGFGQRGLGALARAVPTFDADGRKLAIEAMVRIADPDAVGILLSLLDDEDENVWAAAIDAVAELQVVTPEVTRQLERALGCGIAYKVLVVLEAINRLRVRVDFALLVPLFDDPLLQRAATIAAGRSGNPEAARVIRSALEESSSTLFSAGLGACAEMAMSGAKELLALRQDLKLSAPALHRLLEITISTEASIDEQRNALLAAGAIASPEALSAIIRRLGDYRVSNYAEIALRLVGADAIGALVKASRESDLSRRAVSIELLGHLADATTREHALDAIRAALSDESQEIICAALEALARIGDDESMTFVMRWFDGKFSAQVRLAAGAALAAGARRNPHRAKEIASDISADEPSAAVVALFITVLDEPLFADRSRTVRFLAEAIANPEPFVRRIALDALDSDCDEAVVEAIAFALNDEAEDVQLAAVRALGRIRDDQGEAIGLDHLICLVRATPNEALRAVALESLGASAAPRALELLHGYCLSKSPLLAVAALEALAGFPAKERSRVALQALEHRDSEVVKAALRVLGECFDSSLVSGIEPCLRHEAWDVRRLAVDAMGLIGSDLAKQALSKRLTEETEAQVIDAIRRNLKGHVTDERTERAHRDELP